MQWKCRGLTSSSWRVGVRKAVTTELPLSPAEHTCHMSNVGCHLSNTHAHNMWCDVFDRYRRLANWCCVTCHCITHSTTVCSLFRKCIFIVVMIIVYVVKRESNVTLESIKLSVMYRELLNILMIHWCCLQVHLIYCLASILYSYKTPAKNSYDSRWLRVLEFWVKSGLILSGLGGWSIAFNSHFRVFKKQKAHIKNARME